MLKSYNAFNESLSVIKQVQSIYNKLNSEYRAYFIRKKRDRIPNIISGDYTILEDGYINVFGSVSLQGYDFDQLPLKFKDIVGHFCINSNKLINLIGSPERVSGYFACTSNKLESLEGAPKIVGSYFACAYNKNLKCFEHCPISPTIYASDCSFTNFNGFPYYVENIHIDGNPVNEIYTLFNDIKCINWINEFEVIYDDMIILDRLEMVYDQMNIDFPEYSLLEEKIVSYKLI